MEDPPPPPSKPPPKPTPEEETASLLAAWQISPALHTHILHTQILPTELYSFLSSTPPNSNQKRLAVLILGQTGAGKTRLAPLFLQAPQNQSPNQRMLHLIADTYKTYHPSYHTCLTTTSPSTAPLASRLAGPDAAAWLHQVCLHAARGPPRVDVLLETACRSRSDFNKLVSTVFVREGYAVRVVVLAVPAVLSRLGILVRYWRRLPEAGSRGLPVRLTPRVVHDESFAGLGGAVGLVDSFISGSASSSSSGASSSGGGGAYGSEGMAADEIGEGGVERVVVLRRNGVVVYRNRRGDDGTWEGEAGALSALERERARPLTAEERRAAEADMAMLRAMGEPAVDRELEEIERLMDGLGTADDKTAPDMAPFDAPEFVSKG
ncbi:zeta toxin-domain-containing protein [Chaetomidium leptoderma]|uniref:Zeta toxin-domain-containing protein n=1 Tax=Chaetomidium leptoderma TaxID=669021 RepID=A0AAN6VHT4_9PEZI|nr:zeta toxin-domain-containing protein [Chaetomidium leptoderma]